MGTIVDYNASVLNILDSGESGDFGDDNAFGVVTAGHRTLGAVDDLSMVARGVVRITTAGDYTFCIDSDDSFTLQFPGRDFWSRSGPGNIEIFADGAAIRKWDGGVVFYGDPVLGVIYLPVGDHPFVLTYREGLGEASVEFSAAAGVKGSLDADFKLVGDTGAGGLPLVGASTELIGVDIGDPSPP